MENYQNRCDNKQLNSNKSSFHKNRKYSPIELDQEKEEKDKQFKKVSMKYFYYIMIILKIIIETTVPTTKILITRIINIKISFILQV